MIDFEELERMNVFKPEILGPLIKWMNFHIAAKQVSPQHLTMEFIQKPVPVDYCKHDLYPIMQNFKFTEELSEPMIYTIAYLFMCINRFEDVFTRLCDQFFSLRNYRIFNDRGQVIVLLYVFIFRISTMNMNKCEDFVSQFGIKKLLSVVTYILRKEAYKTLCTIGLSTYDDEFVNEKLMWPYTYALPLLKDFEQLLRYELEVKKICAKKQNTVPMVMNVLNHPKKPPRVPPNTPADMYKVRKSGLIPRSVYEKLPTDEILAAMREYNKMMAENLLKQANRLAPRCAQPKKKLDETVAVDKKSAPYVRKPPPVFKPVEIKFTTTTILRECARIVNEETREVQKLRELEGGSRDPEYIVKLEEERRQREREEEAIKLEEKHLTALLSREGALLAKQTLLNEVKLKGDNVRKEMQDLNKKLETLKEVRRDEAQKIVEKCRMMETASRLAYEEVTNEKRRKAAEISEESRRLRETLARQKEEDLRKKAQIIEEITAIQAFRSTWVKEFDPTETSGSGLLCEMSLAELKERLCWLKLKSVEEAEKRKAEIRQKREKQKNFIVSTQNALAEYKACRSEQRRAAASVEPGKRQRDVNISGLEALRTKLKERRALTKRLQQ